ncbi:MAG: UDP-N-acetylglucosamine 1-carboxyvinyltransferase 1 [bacterium ADurb.Bin236]|nr:MAG: UDP-N-acetylglucosamine 1-carboxyvinyltransferase 1 [bacterium ADurb.Bin236]HOY63895.1 UDP-N-acetylglucosamine 1-carboxyvinyltransferase [bacterium]HPN95350.1 UDP-N-acetylglucosamine 1-carboxyvinyltransferase [bacterium]
MPKANGDSCIQVNGSARLKGEVKISGNKNAALPILAAALLTEGDITLNNMPDLSDIRLMRTVLNELGAKTSFDNGVMTINARDVNKYETRFELMNQMRASIYVIGPLLARFGVARAPLPGGCAIGSRPVDFHINALVRMGATLTFDHGSMELRCAKLRGQRIYLDFPSVGATANIMMAAALAEGTTVIENAAEEPHIQDLAWFIKSIGGRVNGAGTKTISIEGVAKLHGASHTMIPDNIEAGTFMAAAAITRGNISVEGVQLKDLRPIIVKLMECGVSIKEHKNALKVVGRKKLDPLKITTLPHPGFPTDMQPQMMALLSTAEGVSIIKETVWENRFMHVAELARMGANVNVQGNTCVIIGTPQLNGSKVVATDLRAGAALVLAGLASEGPTTVYRADHIDRGYERFEEKLRGLGADVTRPE